MKTVNVDLEKYVVLKNRLNEDILYAVEKELWDKVEDHQSIEYKKGTNSSILVDCFELYFDTKTNTYLLTDKLVKVESVYLGGVLIDLNLK